MSIPLGNGDTGEQNVHTSSISSARALYYDIKGTVANDLDKLVLVRVTIIIAVIT